MREVLIALLKLMVPPKADDLEGQARWRWVVFAGLVTIGVGLALHISLAAGAFPQVFSGYALESETQSIIRKLNVIATLDLEHEMRGKAAELCMEHDAGRRAELNDDIAKLQREYWEVNHEYYQIPECARL